MNDNRLAYGAPTSALARKVCPTRTFVIAAVFGLVAASAGSTRAQGIFLPFVGPTNQSFGGVGVAAPIDSIGALATNPATISGVQSSEVAFGLGLALPTTHLSSTVGANAFGPGLPPVQLSGTQGGEPGVCAVPTIGFVHRNTGSPWSIGLGIYGIGGFSANYAATTTNPITMPQGTAATGGLGGLGRIHAKVELYQVAPTISYALSDKFSVGVSPLLTMANFSASPFFLGPPNDADGDGFFRYGPGDGARTAFGGGFQLGAYYITEGNFRYGVSYKSPQWMEPFRVNSQDELGMPLLFKYNFDLPSTTSFGISYSGVERRLAALDVRYLDYANSDGFGPVGFLPNAAVAGLGWKSIFNIATGLQWEATDRLTLRTGYSFNENPISSSVAFYNVKSSLIIQHWLSFGATYRWNSRVSSTVAYTHGFENEITGPMYAPGVGPVPGTSVTERISGDVLNAGVTVNF
ncbi:MAG: outer membrane protein transport protein [Pirellulales bacterium]